VWHNSYMPQASTLPSDTPASGQAPPPAASVSDVAVNQIQASLQVIARSISQVRTHERLLQSAGVRLDRAGAAALYKLYVHGEAIRVTTLAEMLDVDTPTVTRKVQQLERDGLVVRHADPADGRASRIRLTPAGRRTLERVLKARRAWLDGMLAGWDDEDLARFGSLLGRFSASLEHEMEDARGS
jgi:DNA-binding MarR family transcriptional regulator